MLQTVIRGGHIVTPLEERLTDITFQESTITSIGSPGQLADAQQVLDATGCFVTPALIDLQVNGSPACNFWGDPTLRQVAALSDELVRAGVLTILPTLITDEIDHLLKNIEFLKNEVGVGQEQLTAGEGQSAPVSGSAKHRLRLVRMPGIHLEGPCLSPKRPGVHPAQHLAPLSLSVLRRIIMEPVRLMTLAPELDPSFASIQFLKDSGVRVSIGHSDATFEQAEAAFDQGVHLMTHTFNALPPIHHRDPGAVTAALLDERVSCCLILDGSHVLPSAAKLVVRLKGAAKLILVTDVASIGTASGGLVGSSIMLDQAVRNAVHFGLLGFRDAIRAASLNPACAMGWNSRIGHLAPGKQADIILWDKDTLSVKHVIKGGELLF